MPPDLSAKQIALQTLANSDKTESEIRILLMRKGADDLVVDETVDWLGQLGLLSDMRVAEREKERNSVTTGKNRLKQKLEKRGVSEQIQAEVLNLIPDEEERTKALAFVRSRKWKNPQQAARALYSRGFDEEVTLSVCEEEFSQFD